MNEVAKRSRSHPVYKKADGTIVPGASTVSKIIWLNKRPLLHWAHKLGRDGIDMDKHRDRLAGIGTLTHQMILDYLKGQATDTSEYADDEKDLAANCFLKYLEWERQQKGEIEPIFLEEEFVSEVYGFGGRLDFFGLLDGKRTLIDFKTGKGIYDDMWYQLGGYAVLLEEYGHGPIESYRILNIGRDETEKFIDKPRASIEAEKEIFLHALAIYQLSKNRREP